MSAQPVPSRRAPRSRVLPLLGLGLGGLILLAAIVIIATGNGPPPVQITGVSETNQLLGGIQQDGNALGSPDAPVTISIFDDLQCPTCGNYYKQTVPPLVEAYVRDGDARLQFRNFAFAGQTDTNVAGVGAAAAGGQDREWQFVHLLYLNLAAAGPNVTDEFLRAIAGGAGLDIERWETARDSPAAQAQAQSDATLARDLDFRAAPAVVVDGPGGTRTLQDAPSVAEIQAAVTAVR